MPPPPLTLGEEAAIFADSSGLRFLRPRPQDAPNGGHWVGGWKLGTGAYGQVSLWLFIDSATHAPLASVAIKDTASSKPTIEEGVYEGIYERLVEKCMDFGLDPGRSRGQADPAERFFKEAYIQGTMTVPNSTEEMFSVPLYDWARKQPSIYGDAYQHYRLYMPSYEYGDLNGLISAHRRIGRAVPEPFIWHTLECLLKAAKQLEVQAREHARPRDSDVIVVFDMKPDNILLAPPDRDSSFPIYPRPHLADLGGACLTNRYDAKNINHNMSFQRTQGYDAPEMTYEAPLKPGTLRGTCTNLWQIGRVAEALMKLEPWFKPIDYGKMVHLEDRSISILSWQGSLPGQNYSAALRMIIRDCLKFEPSARPGLETLLPEIEQNKPLHCQGIDKYGSDDWFKIERTKANARDIGKPPPHIDSPETEASRREERELKRRLDKAAPWLRTWTLQEGEELCKLNVFPDENLEVEYRPKNNFWTTDENYNVYATDEVTFIHPLPYRIVAGAPRRVVSQETTFLKIGDLHLVSNTAQGGAPLS
ncbi:hypothetical protein E4T42_05636 [Aureobasidium subglaciale]|nr:hypothetical protein E4T42_05636 [Aureobasidium subglaciale]